MSLNVKVLGNNTIGSTQSDNDLLTAYSANSYAVPSGKAVIVKNIRLVSSANRTVTVNYLPSGANPRAISPRDLSLLANNLVILDEELTLGAGDKLRASFGESGSADVDFVISGVERDQA